MGKRRQVIISGQKTTTTASYRGGELFLKPRRGRAVEREKIDLLIVEKTAGRFGSGTITSDWEKKVPFSTGKDEEKDKRKREDLYQKKRKRERSYLYEKVPTTLPLDRSGPSRSQGKSLL